MTDDRPRLHVVHLGRASGLLLLLLVCTPGAASAQTADYEALIRTYAAGASPLPVATLASWPLDRVREAVAHVRVSPGQIKPAVMLHTEAAFVVRDKTAAFFHIDHARALLASVEGSDARRLQPFVNRWHAIAIIADAQYVDFGRVRSEFDRALQEDIENADARLVVGALYEMDARLTEPNLQGRWNTDSRGWGPIETRLGTAASEYNKILATHPSFLEARLRLGWVLLVRRSSADRVREQLEQVVARSGRQDMVYLAHLFLGALEEREDHFEEARREYALAHSTAKRQSSFIALIRINHAMGRDDVASDLAAELAGTPDVGADDPWRNYKAGLTSGELIEWLRREARSQ